MVKRDRQRKSLTTARNRAGVQTWKACPNLFHDVHGGQDDKDGKQKGANWVGYLGLVPKRPDMGQGQRGNQPTIALASPYPSTTADKKEKYTIQGLELYQMKAAAIMTPMLWIRSPMTWMNAACAASTA